MMAPFRVTKPRILTQFLLEGALVFAVLSGMASLATLVTPGTTPTDLAVPILLAGVTFTGLLVLTRSSAAADHTNLLSEIVVFSVLSMLLGLLALGAVWIFLEEKQPFSVFFVAGAVGVPLALAGWRWFSLRFAVLNATRERLLIVGTGSTAQQVCRLIGSKFTSEYAVLGFADETEERLGQALAMGARVQTDFAALPRYAPRRVDRIIVALDEKRGRLPVRQLVELRLARHRRRGSDLVRRARLRQDRRRGDAPLLADFLGGLQDLSDPVVPEARGGRGALDRAVDPGGAADALRGPADPAGQRGGRFLPANPGRNERPRVRRAEVPLDAAGRRGQLGPDVGKQERPARHPRGTGDPGIAHRRAPPAVQRLSG